MARVLSFRTSSGVIGSYADWSDALGFHVMLVCTMGEMIYLFSVLAQQEVVRKMRQHNVGEMWCDGFRSIFDKDALVRYDAAWEEGGNKSDLE